jgi:hypothetical protein
MATKTPHREGAEPEQSVIHWLLDSDPSIRWQVMRDLMGESQEAVAGERSRVASEGWGSRLLNLQAPDGHVLPQQTAFAIENRGIMPAVRMFFGQPGAHGHPIDNICSFRKMVDR